MDVERKQYKTDINGEIMSGEGANILLIISLVNILFRKRKYRKEKYFYLDI